MASIFELEQPGFGRHSTGKLLVAATDAATTLTAAQSVGSIVTMTPTAARTVTTPVAADIIAELGSQAQIGQTFEVSVINLAGATHAITFTAGATGVTIVGNAVVAATGGGTFTGRIASATTVVYYRA
tara:strand:- start:22814 stop:23197 length:384 start_codon:yes stop_codon:yes gene_type:complete